MTDSRALTREVFEYQMRSLNSPTPSERNAAQDFIDSHDAAQREEIATLRERLREILALSDAFHDSLCECEETPCAFSCHKAAIRAEVFGQEGK